MSDEQAEEDNDSNSVVAESSLDRLACGLGGKTVLPHINATLSQMLQSDNWKCRHAALMAISAVGEGCHKQMEVMLPQVSVLPLNGVTISPQRCHSLYSCLSTYNLVWLQ